MRRELHSGRVITLAALQTVHARAPRTTGGLLQPMHVVRIMTGNEYIHTYTCFAGSVDACMTEVPGVDIPATDSVSMLQGPGGVNASERE